VNDADETVQRIVVTSLEGHMGLELAFPGDRYMCHSGPWPLCLSYTVLPFFSPG